MSTWPWWTPCAPTAPWGPSWSPRLRYCSRTGALALGQALCCALLAYLLPLPLSWSPGGVRGGREAGADLLQEGGAAGDRACGEHERLRLPPLLGESWVVLGVGGQHRPPPRPGPLWAERMEVDPMSLCPRSAPTSSPGEAARSWRDMPASPSWVSGLGLPQGPAPSPGRGGLPPTLLTPHPGESCHPQASCAFFCRSTWEAAGPAGRLLGVLGRLSPGTGPVGHRQCCPRAPGLRGWTGPPSLALTAHSPPLPRLGAPGPRTHAEPGGRPGLHPGLSRQPRLPRALLHRPEDSQPDARGALLTEAG